MDIYYLIFVCEDYANARRNLNTSFPLSFVTKYGLQEFVFFFFIRHYYYLYSANVCAYVNVCLYVRARTRVCLSVCAHAHGLVFGR